VMLLLMIPETIRRLASCVDGNEASEKRQLLLVSSSEYLRLPLKNIDVMMERQSFDILCSEKFCKTITIYI